MTRLVSILVPLLVLSGCGLLWDDSDHRHPPEPVAANNTDGGSDAAGTDEPANNDPNNSQVEQQPTEFARPEPVDRCASGDPRCAADPTDLESVRASRISYMMLAPPPAGEACDDVASMSGNALACLFEDAAPYTEDPLEPADFLHDLALEAYRSDEEWQLDVWRVGPGEPAPIRESSYEAGARSRWGFDDVTIDEDSLVAHAGNLQFRTNYWGFELPIDLRGVTFESTVSMADGEPILGPGTLIGEINLVEFYESLNAFADACEPGWQPYNPSKGELVDRREYLGEDQACAEFADYVVIFFLLPTVADIDTNADGLNDAVSVTLEVDFEPSVLVHP